MLRMIATPVLLLCFFGWGVYTLNRRLRYRDEFSLRMEVATLSAVLLFYVFEIEQLRILLRGSVLMQIFGVVALFVSGMALYGHMLISFGTRLLVEAVSQGEDFAPDQPRFGPAEILERQNDFEGALQQYLVLARIFPSNAAVFLRIAQCHLRLGKPSESAPWFQRSLRCSQGEQERLTALNQFCEVLENTLGQRETARKLLIEHIEQFPDCPALAALERRIERLGAEKETFVTSAELTRLDEAPLNEAEAGEAPAPQKKPGETIRLEAAGTPLGALEEEYPGPVPEAPTEPSGLLLEAIDTPFAPEPAPDDGETPGPKKSSSIGLDAL